MGKKLIQHLRSKARMSTCLVWAQDFFHLLLRSKELKGKLTHRVNHILKLSLVEEMVINTILLTIVGPPCGVTDSVDANMHKYGFFISSWGVPVTYVNFKIQIFVTDP